jgi:hypothetical protein
MSVKDSIIAAIRPIGRSQEICGRPAADKRINPMVETTLAVRVRGFAVSIREHR